MARKRFQYLIGPTDPEQRARWMEEQIARMAERNAAIRADNARRRAQYENNPNYVVVNDPKCSWRAYHKTSPQYAAVMRQRAERERDKARDARAVEIMKNPVDWVVNYVLENDIDGTITRIRLRELFTETGAAFKAEYMAEACARLQADGFTIK